MKVLWDENRLLLQHIMRRHLESSEIPPAADDYLEVDVSYDETWITRRYKLHMNVGFVFVLDFEVISNICWECTCTEREKKMSSEDFTT